jgi:hypothetical protein
MGRYEIGKPISGSGEVTFRNSLPTFVEDYDDVTVGNQSSIGEPRLTLRAFVTGETLTNITVSCSVSDDVGGGANGVSIGFAREPVTANVFITGTNPYTITKPVGTESARVVFTATKTGFTPDSDPVVVPAMPPFVSLVMVDTDETMGSLFVSSSINVAYGSSIIPAISLARSNNVRFVTSLGAGRYEIGKPISGSGDVVFISSLSGYVDDLDTVTVGNQQNIILPRLSVRATVTGQTPTTLTVSCSVVDPLNAPAFSLGFTREPATSTIGIVGTNPFIINKPFGTDVVKVNFTATQVNRQSDSDPVIVNPIPAFLSLLMVPINVTQLVLRVSSSVNESPNGITPTIVLSSATGLMSSSMVSPGVFDLFKNINGAGFATFRATLAGFTEDYDTVTVGNQTDLDLPRLTIRATVTAETSQNLTISCSVIDPLNAPNFTITTIKEPIDSSIIITGTNPYVVTRPIGTGSAKVNFIATQPDRLLDIDPQVIPTQNQPALIIRVVPNVLTTTTSTYEILVVDPIPESPITLEITPTNVGISSIPALSSTNFITVISGQVITLTATRPEFGTTTSRISLRATSLRRAAGVSAIDVTDRGITDIPAGRAIINAPTYVTTFNQSNLTFTIPAASTAQIVEVFVLESVASLTTAPVDNIGSQIKESPFIRTQAGDETFNGTIPFFRAGNFVAVTLVPYDVLNRKGIVRPSNILTVPAPPVIPVPQPFQSAVFSSRTTTSITNNILFPVGDANPATTIRIYLNNVVYGTITATGGTQSITHSGLSPNTTYVWSYAPVNASGEGARTTDLTVTTDNTVAVPLPTPIAYFAGINGLRATFVVDNSSQFPAGTSFFGEISFAPSPSFNALDRPTPNTFRSNDTQAGDFGVARFFATNPSYLQSAFSDLVNWNNGNQV